MFVRLVLQYTSCCKENVRYIS